MLVHVLVMITNKDVTEDLYHAQAHARIARPVIERRQMAGRRQTARLPLFQYLGVALLTMGFLTSKPDNNVTSSSRPVATICIYTAARFVLTVYLDFWHAKW